MRLSGFEHLSKSGERVLILLPHFVYTLLNLPLSYRDNSRYASVASRVRSLHIRPKFLPGVNSKGRAIPDPNTSQSQQKKHKSHIRAFLETALASLVTCPYLKELDIVIHDQYLSESFARFLHKLLKRVGTTLESLTIDMTLPSFLSVYHVFNPALLPKLSSLTIKITNSRFETSRKQARQTRKVLLSIIRPLIRTLQFLAFEVIDFNLSELFQRLKQLPKLRSLELRAEVGFSTLIPIIHFATFLKYNADNLERLVIHRPTVDIPNSWDSETIVGRLYNLLCVQHLPKLQELVIEVDFISILDSLANHVHTFVPHLKNLTLIGQSSTLDHSRLSSLLSGLADGDKGLEYLKISITHFSPEQLDLLAHSLPNLRRLDLSYHDLWMNTQFLLRVRKILGVSLSYLIIHCCPQSIDSIYDVFRTRSYSSWNLEEARIVEVSHCVQGHPDMRLLDAIEESLPSLRRIVRTQDCNCRC